MASLCAPPPSSLCDDSAAEVVTLHFFVVRLLCCIATRGHFSVAMCEVQGKRQTLTEGGGAKTNTHKQVARLVRGVKKWQRFLWTMLALKHNYGMAFTYLWTLAAAYAHFELTLTEVHVVRAEQWWGWWWREMKRVGRSWKIPIEEKLAHASQCENYSHAWGTS